MNNIVTELTQHAQHRMGCFISPLTLIAVVLRQQTVTDTAVTQRFCLYLSLCQELNRGSGGLKIEGMFSNMTQSVTCFAAFCIFVKACWY